MSPKANLFWLHPGRWLPLLCLVLLSYGVTDAAAANLVTITVTVTNPPTTSNTFYTASSATTRLSIWTNATTSTTILTNLAGINQSATNLFFHLANYPILGVTLRWIDTNQFSMRGTSLSVTSSVEWCELATNSLAGTNTYSLALPFANLDLTHRTNQASEVTDGIDDYSTNRSLSRFTFISITNTTFAPFSTNRVDGDWSWTAEIFTNLTTGANSNLNLGTNVFVRLEGPIAAGPIVGLTNGLGYRSGLFKLLFNGGQRTIYITNESPLALAANRILTPNAAAVALGTNGLLVLTYDASTNRWLVLSGGSGSSSGSSGVPLTNTVWVAKGGSDSTGARGDASKPFLTLGAAKTAATYGDTIYVMPGTYDGNDLLKTGVNWYFFDGTIVTSSANGVLFDDNGTGTTNTILGYGIFRQTNGWDNFDISGFNTLLEVTARRIENIDVNGSGAALFLWQGLNSRVTFSDTFFTNYMGRNAFRATASTNLLTLIRCDVNHYFTNGNLALTFGVLKGTGTNLFTLRDSTVRYFGNGLMTAGKVLDSAGGGQVDIQGGLNMSGLPFGMTPIFVTTNFIARLHAPTNVAPFGIDSTDVVLGQLYTNGPNRGFVSASFSAICDVAAFAEVALWLDQDNSGGFEQTGIAARFDLSASLRTNKFQLGAFLQPGAAFVFTNLSTDATNVSVNTGGSQWVGQ